MTIKNKIMMGGAGLAAFAAAAPASAQYYPYAYNNASNIAAQQCAAAVQNRLSYRTNTGIFGAILGTGTSTRGQVLSVTQVTPRRNTVRVRGVATSGRLAYNPYGVGAYGMLGSNYAADLTFRCDVDYRGYVRDVDINRR